MYSNGDSERIIGKALKTYDIPRSNVTLLTKCAFGLSHDGTQLSLGESMVNDGPMVNRVGLSRKHIFDAVDASVERLGTYIDVLQIHRLDRDTPKREIMRALNDVVESGKVRYIGASSVCNPPVCCFYTIYVFAWGFLGVLTALQMATWEFQQLQNLAEKHNWHKFISMQNYLNLLYREEEREMLPYCAAAGIGMIPWSPIARGVLARPWGSRNTKREETDQFLGALIRSRENEIDQAIVGRVEEIAKRKSVPMAAVATAWVLSKGANPIVGLSSKERIDSAVAAISMELSEEEVQFLEEPYLPKIISGY